jgi:hypothetical protein
MKRTLADFKCGVCLYFFVLIVLACGCLLACLRVVCDCPGFLVAVRGRASLSKSKRRQAGLFRLMWVCVDVHVCAGFDLCMRGR